MKDKLFYIGCGFFAGIFAKKAMGCLSFVFWVVLFIVLYNC